MVKRKVYRIGSLKTRESTVVLKDPLQKYVFLHLDCCIALQTILNATVLFLGIIVIIIICPASWPVAPITVTDQCPRTANMWE